MPYYPYFCFVQSPYEMGAEHYRLLDQAVTVPSDTTRAIGEAARVAGMVVSIGVSERDGGTLYNTQLLFDADGTLIQRRRKISPTYHERMVWGMGDGSGLRAVDSAVGRIGQLACWEHYNPLARYAPDGRRRADPFRDVPRVLRRRPLLRADFGQHPPARAGSRLLRRLRHGMARRRPAGADHERHRLRHRTDLERLLHGDHRPRKDRSSAKRCARAKVR